MLPVTVSSESRLGGRVPSCSIVQGRLAVLAPAGFCFRGNPGLFEATYNAMQSGLEWSQRSHYPFMEWQFGPSEDNIEGGPVDDQKIVAARSAFA